MNKTLVIVPTLDCQLRCSFCLCLESLGTSKGSSVEEMVAFLDWQIQISQGCSFTIEVFGGEPTLAHDKIRQVYDTITQRYPDVDMSWTLFTNGLFPKSLVIDEFIPLFGEVIISLEGSWELSKDRHPNPKSHQKVVENIKKCLPYGNTGVAFTVFPDTDLEGLFSFFLSLGVWYFNFEIVTHVNNDKASGVTLRDLYKIFLFIYENILLWNLENRPLRVFTIPRELLAARNHLPGRNCIDTVRALAPSGNVYFCRDMAVNEYKLTQQSNLIYHSSIPRQYNIKDFLLDKDTDQFKREVREYEMWNSCPLKSMEHYHFIGGSQAWIKDRDFQDLLIRPLFDIEWSIFELHHTGVSPRLEEKIITYKKVLDFYADEFGY